MMNKEKVWLVTGASRGLEFTLVKQLLEHGFTVAALSRNINLLQKAIGPLFHGRRFLPLRSWITDDESTKEAIEKIIDRFGHIDMVVNNAGYDLEDSEEELTAREIRENFEVNVFGTLNIIRKVLPYLREQRSGHIINISSIGACYGIGDAFTIYTATRFAILGMSEALAAELKPFGINVTIVSTKRPFETILQMSEEEPDFLADHPGQGYRGFFPG